MSRASLPASISGAAPYDQLKYLRLLNVTKYQAIVTLLTQALEDEWQRQFADRSRGDSDQQIASSNR